MLRRSFSSVNSIIKSSAMSVFERSCYHKIDFKISEDACVKDAVNRFTAFNIGCLAVTDKNNKVVGVCSERDFISKIASYEKDLKETKVREICTYTPIIIAKKDDSLETCMNKRMFKDIRQLLVVADNNEEFIGMISIKYLIK